MKNLKLKFIAPLMCLACHVVVAGAAESTLCRGHGALGASENVLATRERNMSESTSECKNLVLELSNLESPTIQQRYDLATAMRDLAEYTDRDEMLELFDRAGDVFYSLHEERPNDLSLLHWKYIHSEEKEGVEVLRRMLRVAPDCSNVRNHLLDHLNFSADYLDDPDVPEEVRAEISHHISVGYDLATEIMWKMRFGSMMFDSIRAAGRAKSAKQFHKRISEELSVANLSYDDASRTENLNAICDPSAFRLRFTEQCLDAIELTLSRDIDQGGPLGKDVLQAMKALGMTLTSGDEEHMFDEFNHPADVNERDFDEISLFPPEAVRYAIRLGNMIRNVPDEMQTFELHLASYVLGRESRLRMLEGILKREPDNEEVRIARDSYLEM